MGLLSEGKTLKWPQSKKYIDFIKINGIRQFLNVYESIPKEKKCNLMYGDELEYILIKLDEDNKSVDVFLGADEAIEKLKSQEGTRSIWHPEYSNYMIEGTPDKPYRCSIGDLLSIESDLIERRLEINSNLPEDCLVTTLTSFPTLGCHPFRNKNIISKSDYLSDDVIGNHIRFHTLTENIRLRRGEKVNIVNPVYQDIKTDPNLDIVEMDCMCFGMGCSCLQSTYQTANEAEARYLYDMLAVISPIFLALTAATPILRGHLVDTDCRWDVISQSVDDRTEKEYEKLQKSRYSSISYFISSGSEPYNDSPSFEPDPEVDKIIQESGIDHLLAQHLNYIFTRDPLVIFEDGLPINPISLENTLEGKISGKVLDKYENIHSTNWNTVRLKVPVPEVCGWRVEFRPMEIQSNDKANASFLVFVNLMVRSIIKYQPNWYIPISMVDHNMEVCQKRYAILDGKVYHRIENKIVDTPISKVVTELYEMITAFINDEMKGTDREKEELKEYIDYVNGVGKGQIKTDARNIREFVSSHPSYNKDSIISDEICYDLIKKLYV